MERKNESNSSKIMTKEEEEELEAMIRQRRGRGMAFYDKQGPPTERETLSFEPLHSSGLSEPGSKTINKRMLTHSSRLRIGYADTIGKRATMEDEIVIKGNLCGDNVDYVAIFDGHGGKAASEFAAKHLHEVLLNKMEELKDPEQALKRAFITTNEMMKKDSITGGTTAICALFIGRKCYVANAGDSRAVLCKGDKAFRLSKDHKPDDPEEESRIVQAGGVVMRINNTKLGKTIGRVNGMLAVSRALGDLFLQPYVTPEPDVKCIEISSSQNQLLILACDGLWDVLSDEEATRIAVMERDPERAAIKLRDAALDKSSTDNISVVVVQLPPLYHNKSDLEEDNGPVRLSKGTMVLIGLGIAVFLLMVVNLPSFYQVGNPEK